MPDDEIDISALLRMKRDVQPPPGYFDQLLQDVHRRQRAELLRRPLWKIGIERVQTFFGEHSMGGLSYAGAMASVLVLGVATIRFMTPATPLAENRAPAIAAAAPVAQPIFSLQNDPVSLASVERTELQPASVRKDSAVRPPRYIIDARPASYDPPPSL